MQFGVLGPLQVIGGNCDAPGTVTAGRLRALLAVLLWRANQPVPADELAELVWDGTPPAGVADATRALVMRLRRRLDKQAAARIVTRAPGYAIEVSCDELDASRFEELTRQAGAAIRAGQWGGAGRTAADALALWRGTPLVDVPSQSLRDQWMPRLEQLHAQALDWRIDSDLHEGRHEQLIPELRDLTARHPLREGFHGQLMRALCRCGRQAEALAAFQRARDVLVAELGVGPGPELRELHQRILSSDPDLTESIQLRSTRGGPRRATPRELPPAVPGFTGRSAELRTLTSLLDGAGEDAPGAVVISAIGGTPGVGKTALAIHWAHQMADRFPDGQLYVNLRGHDPDRPVPAADALAGFLGSLGVPGQDIPAEAAERAVRYRSLLADKRMLIVLDNAGSADQVRPLLPGTPASAVVVTSRDALSGLVVRDGAARLDLDVLPVQDAVALLRALIGSRVDAEPAATAELADQCCRLPLALRVAAQLVASRPNTPMAGLTNELSSLQARLDLLAVAGDTRTEVRTVFSWSYDRLDVDVARTFRLLGLHPGSGIEPHAAAALAGTGVRQARRALAELARAHLIQPTGPGRYGMHDLLRAYASEVSAVMDTRDEQRAALTRLFDYYLYTAAAAMDVLFPAERGNRPRVPRPATPVPALPDQATARDWLDGERAILVAVTGHAAASGWPDHAIQLAATLSTYLRSGVHFQEARTVFSHALDAARRTGDGTAEASIHGYIGDVDRLQSRFLQAVDHQRQALALSRGRGDRAREANALGNIGLVETQLGRHEEAARNLTAAIAIYHEIGNRFGEARSLGNLGLARRLQGRYHDAADFYQRSLVLSREIGDRTGEAWALSRLGSVDLRLRDYQQAAGYLQQALAMFQEIGDAAAEAELLIRLGEVHLGLGDHQQAARDFELALVGFREIGAPAMEADALNGLGEALFHKGDADAAHGYHATALRLAFEADAPLEQARAHSGLARSCEVTGNPAQAHHHWQEALAGYTAIDAPEARQVRDRLAMTGDGHGR
jgi:DNA-binding SARP family transcriptional activator/tetratricopeptide (TPR) repeat protein